LWFGYRKTVAKGGRVVEHQAFKHINTGGLPEAFEISGLSAGAEDTKDSQDHALAEVTVQISTVAITPKFHQTPSTLQTKQGAEASNGQDKEEETLESNLLMSEVPVERQKGERSSQLRKKEIWDFALPDSTGSFYQRFLSVRRKHSTYAFFSQNHSTAATPFVSCYSSTTQSMHCHRLLHLPLMYARPSVRPAMAFSTAFFRAVLLGFKWKVSWPFPICFFKAPLQ